MRKFNLQIATLCSMMLFISPVKADSFFDVFFDISFDKASQTPELKATGRMITFGSGVKEVDTEIVSMSLSSHRGEEEGSMSYSSSVAVRSWVPNDDGKSKRVDSFFDVFYKCSSMADNRMKCVVSQTKAKTKGKHRGHVTVLK